MSEIIDCISWIVTKTCLTFWIFLKFTGLRILDLLGLVFNVLACCTIVRLPCMIMEFSDMDSLIPWRYVGLLQFLIFLSDIPVMIGGGILCITVYRLFPLQKELKERHCKWDFDSSIESIYYAGWKPRGIVLKHLFLLLLDLVFIPAGLVCLFSWRCMIFVRAIKKTKDSWEARVECFKQLGLLFLDIPCIILGLICICSWRLPFIVHHTLEKIRGDENWIWDDEKWLACEQFGLLLLDIPCIICLIISFCSWRMPFLIYKLAKMNIFKREQEWKARKVCLAQFILLFADIPCILCSIFLLVTIWRFKFFVQDFKAALKKPSNKQWKIRLAALKQFAMFFTDAGCLILGLVIFATLWRVYPLQRDIRKIVKRKANQQYPFGWKIRKSICLHFVMLLADIPALVLMLLHLCTLIRMPAILAAFIQSGNFYMEFAVTVYYQAYILLIDILFILLFIILSILRPVTAWICVLEDEEHMQYRLLRHHIQWIPDTVAKRHKIYTELDELVTVHLKMYSIPANFRQSANHVFESYIKDLEEVKYTMENLDLDPDYVHLIKAVLWWECKRVDKMARQYTSEYNFLLRPDTDVRHKNSFKLQHEMLILDSKVSEQYRELEKYVPEKVPLWTVETGLKTRTRKETQKVLIKCLPRGDIFLLFIALLCLLPLYRAPKLIKKLSKKWYNRAEIIIQTVKEYGLDLLTLLRMILVIAFIYRAPSLVADITIDIFEKRSWRAVRKTVKKYPMVLWEDFLNFIRTLLSWKTPRFIFTAILFGVLMPADMFLTAAKFCTSDKCSVYVLSGALYSIFVSFPFILSLYLGKKLLEIGLGWVAIPVTCVYIALLLIILACLVRAFVKSKSDLAMVPQRPDYIHWNWYNFHVIVMETLELLQILALVFSLQDIPMYGGKMLNEASNYLLLSFIPFEVKIWLTFALFMIWFFLCAAPVIFEQILEDLPEGKCGGHMGWRMSISLFSNTLFVTILESFASSFSCSYTQCPSSVDYKTLPSNSTCLSASLAEDSSYKCWTGFHKIIALFGLFATLWYTTTSFMVGIQYGDSGTKRQDIGFSPAYNIIANFIKAIMVISVVNITMNNYAVLGVLITCNLLLVLHTLLFKTFFKFTPSNSRSFMVWRVASFLSGIIATVAVLIAYAIKNPDSKFPLIIFGAGTLGTMLVALIVSIILKRPGRLYETREGFKRRLFALEKRLSEDGRMLSSWKQQQRTWKRLLAGVREARPDDHFYEEADWESLCIRSEEATPRNASENDPNWEVEENLAVDVVDIELEIEAKAGPSEPSQPCIEVSLPDDNDRSMQNEDGEAMQVSAAQDDVPPPPSYGSISADSTDAGLTPKFEVAHIEKISTLPIDNPIMSLQRNGVNILLVLEKSIHYKTYAFSFMAQRKFWLSSVAVSNWTGLQHCLDVLESSLDSSFERPSRMDVSVGLNALPGDTLADDPHDSDIIPDYVPESRDPEVIAANSASQRRQALDDVSNIEEHGARWMELMDKVLPTLPIIKSWAFEDGNFEIILKRSASGTIKDVGPRGIKLARGASFSLGKRTKGTLRNATITFSSGYELRASKGPIALTVSDLGLIWKKESWYLETQGKTVKFPVALDSLKEIQWR